MPWKDCLGVSLDESTQCVPASDTTSSHVSCPGVLPGPGFSQRCMEKPNLSPSGPPASTGIPRSGIPQHKETELSHVSAVQCLTSCMTAVTALVSSPRQPVQGKHPFPY